MALGVKIQSSRLHTFRVLGGTLLLLLAFIGGSSCDFDRQDRWLTSKPARAPECVPGTLRCSSDRLERCEGPADSAKFALREACGQSGKICAPSLLQCSQCIPGEQKCDGQTIIKCDADGGAFTPGETCDTAQGAACRGGTCTPLCAQASERRSNVGCEYWGVDLDNANVRSRNVDRIANAAAQQFAIVVSNIQPDVTATVLVERDDSAISGPGSPVRVVEQKIAPMSLFVFKLGPREVDGSPPGEFDTGTHTALTRHAYRVTSNFPVVAYQFNPLENVDVFSNDASLLKPVEALSMPGTPGELVDSYVVLGWPETIGSSEDRNTNFDPETPVNLRSFLTIVGTRPNTRVKIQTRARIVPGGPVLDTPVGGIVEQTLEPFDVLNLETGQFGADFTGSVISADAPVVVFSGSEAADVPLFSTLSSRRCCADHLEEQLDPIRTAGTSFVAAVSPSRSRALQNAGAGVEEVAQSEVFRVVAVNEKGAEITTTLAPDGPATISLKARGDYADIVASRNFILTSSLPVMLGAFSPSAEAAGILGNQPGGDPSFVIVPPTVQFRSSYVFLTPDKYNFDFAQIIAPLGTEVALDRQPISSIPGCQSSTADGLPSADAGGPMGPGALDLGLGGLGVSASALRVYTCQLSFPRIDETNQSGTCPEVSGAAPSGDGRVCPGLQNDGVHVLEASTPVGLLVSGFDAYVSYGYAGGTELSVIVPR
ncbi:MAG: IgGFc-binding protein [Polyangiaceae bacterium]|nr:IgGFc-binding protein [Polyangiaceae bacterium]